MPKSQKNKGKKRPRGWHRSKRSSKVFDRMLQELERADSNGNNKRQE